MFKAQLTSPIFGSFEAKQALALVGFTVSEEHARLARRNDIEPTHEIGLPRVRTESAECVNRRFHGDFLSKNFHLFLVLMSC
jgi:hypothetical protein